jgi:Lon protease-like protein
MVELELPERCGVMILPNCTLFPHGRLPLFIFEPRYRRMLEEALEGNCFFAIGRLMADEETENPADCCSRVGTIGMVRVSQEADDGTSQLLLHGIQRVRFTEWHDDKPYPYASIEPMISHFDAEHQAVAAMKTLRGAVEDALRHTPKELQTVAMSILDQGDTPELLADIVSQQFIHDPDVRQSLLEIPSVGLRISMLCDFLTQLGKD